MAMSGTARLDVRTKDLVKRLKPGDVAVIDHKDIDRVSAEALLETGVDVVINVASSISGEYPNVGPLLLVRGGVHLVDAAGPGVFEKLLEGDTVEVDEGDVLRAGTLVASGKRLTVEDVEHAMTEASANLNDRLDTFVRNTMEVIAQERELLTEGIIVPHVRTRIDGRQVLVVVRGYDYKQDLRVLLPYIRESHPVLIGVDGGADALREAGFRPDIIIGDMDSVSDEALLSGSELVVHAYPDGRCPGRTRLENLGLKSTEWRMPGMSEDLALLLASESGADLIVAVGPHWNLLEHLDKGRKGMASTFLVRLRVGERLVDAKGVSKLYRASVSPIHLSVLVGAGLAVIVVIVLISPQVRSFLSLMLLQLRTVIGL